MAERESCCFGRISFEQAGKLKNGTDVNIKNY